MTTIEELRFQAARRADIGGFSGSLADLSPNEREQVIDTMATIVSETPSDFALNLREFAEKRVASPFFGKPIEEFGLGDAASTFTTEFSNQAKQIVSLQLGTVKAAILLGGVALGFLAFKKFVK